MNRQTTNHITTINTQKFKSTTVKVSFKTHLTRENITPRIMLANVMRNATKVYGSKKILSTHLEQLYGASLSVSAKKQGRMHVISFYMHVANEKFLKSAPPLFEEAVKMLNEVIMNPKIEAGAFDTDVVNLEKRLLKEDIESVYDDKTNYALKEMIKVMCADELFGVNGDGYIEDLTDISETSLVKTYESMLKDDVVEIVVLGDVVHEDVVKRLSDAFSFETGMRQPFSPVDTEEKELVAVVVKKEEQLVNQTKLNMGYRTYTRTGDEDYFALLVFNGVFGGFAHSKLFVNVREKESLCYYCASHIDNFKGLMYVYSGLDLAQVDKAITIIDAQLVDVANGVVSDDELMMAKKSIINGKRESLDSTSGMLADVAMSALLGLTADEFIARIEQVTKEDVAEVAKKIKKDTIFTLEPCATNEEVTA